MLDKTLLLALSVVVTTAVVLLILRHPHISDLFQQQIPDRPRRRLFLSGISFVLTFATARSLAYANYHHIGPFHDIYIHGRHIHHLVWGILLLLAVGYGWLLDAGSGSTRRSVLVSRTTALLYGAGAALTLDEFALWLNLEDVYWSPEGRASIDAVILFAGVLLTGIWGGDFLRAIGREFLALFRRDKKVKDQGNG